MPGVQHGYQRGISMIVEAVVVAIFLGEVVPALVEVGLFPKNLVNLLIITSIIGTVMTIDKARYWSFGYLAGFCIGIPLGLGAFLQTGFLGFFDLLLYGGVTLGAVALKVKIHS